MVPLKTAKKLCQKTTLFQLYFSVFQLNSQTCNYPSFAMESLFGRCIRKNNFQKIHI